MLLFIFILSIYEPLEWTEYRDYRYVQSIDADIRWIWVASTDGIIRYDKLRERWEIPASKIDFPDNISLIGVDDFSNYIWFTTSATLSRYNPTLKSIDQYTLPAEGRSLNIAFTDDFVIINIDDRYYGFDRFTGKFEEIEPGSNIEWKPKNQPQDFTQLSPYFVQDKKLRIYHMTCVILDERLLWVGTEGLGLYKYDIYTFQIEHINFGVPPGKIMAIHIHDDNIWIGGDNNALTLWERKNNRWQYFDLSEYGLYTTKVSEIDSDETSIWFATSEGLIRFHDNKFNTFTVFDGLPSNNITAIEADSNNLWVGTDWGLARIINGKVISLKEFGQVIINDLKLVRDSLLIATPYGVYIKHGKELYAFPDSTGILSTGVSVIDDNGLLVTKMGILTKNGRLLTYPTDLPDPNVYTIESTENEVWIGTANGAVKFDKDFSLREVFNSTNSPIKGAVYKILILENSILFATDNGLVEYKRM
ncbi:hypothetical protein KAT73_01495 [candidate division WOR-3 bacterium]|nr:hypothetical protein [candidate division WOR-3 bacterium]